MKPKLILLHGALGSMAIFKDLTEELNEYFDVFTLNFSGHGGKAFATERFSMPLFTKELRQFIVEQKLAPAQIFGYSMGGYIALWLATYEPNLVKSVFTLGTKLKWSEEEAQKEIKLLVADKIENKIPGFALQLFERHKPNDWKKTVSQTALLIENLGKHHLSQNDFTSLKAHVKLTIGDKDSMVTTDETHQTHQLIPNSQFKILPDTIHPFEKVNTFMLAEEIKLFFL